MEVPGMDTSKAKNSSAMARRSWGNLGILILRMVIYKTEKLIEERNTF